MYLPLAQHYQRQATLALRASRAGGLVCAVCAEMQALDPNLPLFQIETMDDAMAVALARQRTAALLTTGFGLLVAMLAVMGIYGVMSYSVSRRVPELGVRTALGERPGDLLRLVLRPAAALTGAGIAAGCIAAAALARFLSALLGTISPLDPAAFAGASALLAASYLPARRAAEIHPVAALRAE